MEPLGRGIVAIPVKPARFSWAGACWEPTPTISPSTSTAPPPATAPVKLNPEPIRTATNFVDTGANSREPLSYFVRPLQEGRELEASASFTSRPMRRLDPTSSIPLQTLPGHTPNDASVGDLDGDGEYEIVLKQEMRGRDNSQAGRTGETKLEAYELDGRFLWRINLGKNIREGAHYTQFMVYDLDGDGKAEVACKTADGTIDGKGIAIGNADADYRNPAGFILEGPEFLTVFEGATGKALATTEYVPPRGKVADWGDDRGNRVDRFLAAVAYLDGERPSVIMCRGYYTRTVLAAWNWREGALSRVWTFDSDDGTPGNRDYRGQGNHNLRVGDIDGDGKDEIVYGACAIDDNGKGLYTTGLGHGDAIHLSDIDPDRPGLEVFDIHERPRHPNGAEFRDARTGALIWGKPSLDVGRGVTLDIDPRHRGYEMWASGPGLSGLWNVKGEQISDQKPRSCNFGVWWDGDLLREILNGNRISKWDWHERFRNQPGDRGGLHLEQFDRSRPPASARISSATGGRKSSGGPATARNCGSTRRPIPTEHRLSTLMHDPIYRLSVAYQNVGYNQPTQTGFYLGDGMSPPPRPAITTQVPRRGP